MSATLRAILRVHMLMAWRGLLDNLGGGRSRWALLLIPLMLVALLPLVVAFGGMYAALYFGARELGQGHVVLTMAFTAGQVASLLFGVVYVISAFYFSKDLTVLVPLPVRPREIVLAKFMAIMAGQYLTMAPLLLPALVVYGLLAKVGPLYVPYAVVLFLLLPAVPLVIASLFSMVLMRVTNLRRYRDLWRVVGGLFGILLAVGFQFIGRMGGTRFGRAADPMQEFIQAQQGMIDSVGRYFPTSMWASNALQENASAHGIVPFLLFVSVALASLFLMLWVAERLFFGGLIGGDETKSSGTRLTDAELTRQTGQVRAPLWALVQREVRLMNRTPSFLMAAVVPLVLLPVLVLLPLIQQGNLEAIMPGLQRAAGTPLIPVLGIGAILLMNAMSNVAASAISREGKYFWISRALPVSPRIQLQAKLIHSLLFVLLHLVMVVGGLGFLGLLTPLSLLYLVAGALVVSVASGYGALLIDTLRPNLNWTDPQKAMKGNLNVLFSLIMTLLMGAVLAVTTFLAGMVSPALMVPAILVVFTGMGLLLHHLVGDLAVRRYAEYEH
jgi:ABC-2 type transport system permease protein